MIDDLLNDRMSIKVADQTQLKYSELFLSTNYKLLEINQIKLLAGIDISYFQREGREWGVSCAVLWDYKKNELVEYKFAINRVHFSYQPGYLGFRECPLLAAAIFQLTKIPDLLFCDGHGVTHPRSFGEAVQLGMALDIPSCGVAKNFFIGESDWKCLGKKRGAKAPIFHNRKLVGYALCPNDYMKSVFISSGFKTDLELTLEVTLNTTLTHRQPEPLYLADKISREEIKRRINNK